MTVIKFRAGRVKYDPESKVATPDSIQGEVVIKQSDEDESFYSFEWLPKDSVAGIEKDEFLIIPGDATWKQVKECTTGRVFSLTFSSSGARHLFWLQEVNDNTDDPTELSKKDKDILQRIEKALEPVEEDEEIAEEHDLEIPDAQSQSQAEPEQLARQPIYEMNDFLTSKTIQEYVNSCDDEALAKLYSHLPESMEKNKSNLLQVLQGPYFKKAASNLGSGLNNGGGLVISQSLNYPYEGEGITNYLNSVKKQQAGKERKQEDP